MKVIKGISLLFVFIVTCVPPFVHAEQVSILSPKNYLNDSTWFLGVGVGAASIGLANSTSVNNGSGAPPPADQDTFTINNPTATITQFLVGYRFHQAKQYFPYYQLFFRYQHFIDTNIEGTIDQYNLPGFTNYNYRMNYEADLFTLNGKFDVVEYKKFLPYIAIGLGGILNHVNSYKEYALANVTPRTSPAYNGDTSGKLAVSVGLGIDYILSDNIWLTLGYEHIFQGNLKSDDGNGSWSPTKLNFGSIKMDTVFLNLSANFPTAFRYQQ